MSKRLSQMTTITTFIDANLPDLKPDEKKHIELTILNKFSDEQHQVVLDLLDVVYTSSSNILRT